MCDELTDEPEDLLYLTPVAPIYAGADLIEDEASGLMSPDMPDTPTMPQYPAGATPDYSDSMALQAKSAEYATDIKKKQVAIAERQLELAEQHATFYKENIAPLTKDLTEDARRGIDPTGYEARSRNAVMQTVTPQMRAAEVALSTRGVDPSSPMAVSAVKKTTQVAGAQAGAAQVAARDRVDAANRGRKNQVYGLGANIPANTITNLGTASGVVGNAGRQVSSAYTGLSNAYMQQADAEASLARQAWSLQTQSIMNDYERDLQQQQAEQMGWMGLMGAAGQAGGMAFMLL